MTPKDPNPMTDNQGITPDYLKTYGGANPMTPTNKSIRAIIKETLQPYFEEYRLARETVIGEYSSDIANEIRTSNMKIDIELDRATDQMMALIDRDLRGKIIPFDYINGVAYVRLSEVQTLLTRKG